MSLLVCILLAGCAGTEPNGSSVESAQIQFLSSQSITEDVHMQMSSDAESRAEDTRSEPLLGLDFSTHQKSVDWECVKEADVKFVMLRVGYRGYGASGTIREDAMFASHAAGALRVGIPFGVYFHSQAVTVGEAAQEAAFVLDAVREYEISYPIAFDMEFIDPQLEPRTLHLTREERTQIVQTFCRIIAEAGYVPMIYGDARWFSEGVDIAQLSGYDIWYAEYEEAPVLEHAAMVQYSNTGSLPGLGTGLDLNRCYRNYIDDSNAGG